MEVTQRQTQQVEQRTCNKCRAPCGFGNFKQVAGLKHSGLLIYIPKDSEHLQEKKSQGKTKKHFFILHNASDRELRRPDYIKEMCQYRTKCIQCKDFIHRVRSLVDELTDIKQDEVIGVCDHCKRINPSGKCKRCEYFIDKFKCCQNIQKQETCALFMCWLNKVNALVQRILEYKNIYEPPPYLNEFLKLLKELKPLLDVEQLNKSLLPKIMQYGTDVKIMEILEHLLRRMRYEIGMTKYDSDIKLHSVAENQQLVSTSSLAKNKKQLEELLYKLKHDIDAKILSKMLEYAGGAERKIRISQSSSIEYLANNKKMLEELLTALKNKVMHFVPENESAIIVDSKEMLPGLKRKIDELSTYGKKENLNKKNIRKSTSEKVSGKSKEVIKKGEKTDANHKVLKKEKGMKHNINHSDLTDSVTGEIKKKHNNKHISAEKTGHSSKNLKSKSQNLAENYKIQKKTSTKNKLHDLSPNELKEEIHTSINRDAGSNKITTRSTAHNLSGKILKEKLTTNKNKMYGDSPDEIKRFINDNRIHKKVKMPAVPPTLSPIEKKPIKVTSGENKACPLYLQYEFDDLDQNDLALAYNTITVTAVYDGLERPYKITTPQELLSKPRKHGGFLYQLSDREYIEKGWTILPKTKTLRRIFIYKMEPAFPQYNWFENKKHDKMLFYESGEKLAEIDDDGSGRWYYRNGEVALDFFNVEDSYYGGQRCVVYSRGDDVDMGKSSPRTVLACFDYRGNGVVYDRYGNERLKYNQFEGILRDEKVGPTTRWKWNPLNEPPKLHEVQVDNYVKQIDPSFNEVFKNVKDADVPRKSRYEGQRPYSEIAALEYEKLTRRKVKAPVQKFQIRMKALKLNDHFSLRIFDQGKIYVVFRDGPIKQKLNVGMNLLNEVIETDMVESGDVITRYDCLPPLSNSLADIQKRVQNVREVAKVRDEKTKRLLMPPKLSRSAYKVGIGIKEPGPCSVKTQVQYPAFQSTSQY